MFLLSKYCNNIYSYIPFNTEYAVFVVILNNSMLFLIILSLIEPHWILDYTVLTYRTMLLMCYVVLQILVSTSNFFQNSGFKKNIPESLRWTGYFWGYFIFYS